LHLEPTFERAEDPLFHPGKTARTGEGILGELHPRLLDGTVVGVRA
jgi:Phenylalanyl-tRNA synthetase beta subunit